MPNVTGYHKSGRGRPKQEDVQAYKDALEASPKLFDVEPYTISTKKYNAPERLLSADMTMQDWLDYCYEFILINQDVVSLVEIYQYVKNPPFSLLETTNAKDPNIQNLLEEKIINLTLTGRIRSVFASQLLQQKFGWSETDAKEIQLSDTEVKFCFG